MCEDSRVGAGFLGRPLVVGAGRRHKVGTQAGRPRPPEVLLGEQLVVTETSDHTEYVLV